MNKTHRPTTCLLLTAAILLFPAPAFAITVATPSPVVAPAGFAATSMVLLASSRTSRRASGGSFGGRSSFLKTNPSRSSRITPQKSPNTVNALKVPALKTQAQKPVVNPVKPAARTTSSPKRTPKVMYSTQKTTVYKYYFGGRYYDHPQNYYQSNGLMAALQTAVLVDALSDDRPVVIQTQSPASVDVPLYGQQIQPARFQWGALLWGVVLSVAVALLLMATRRNR